MRRTTTLLPPCRAASLLAGVLLASALLLGGCAGMHLGDERKLEPFATLLRQGDDFGTVATRQDGAAVGDTPLQLGIVQMPIRHRGSGPLLVLQPGLLADHTTWRFLAPRLAEHYDLLLVDPPGTGASDKPGLETLGATAYSPAWLGRHTLRAVERWEAAHGGRRRNLVLIGHSLGCASILMTLGDPGLPADVQAVAARVRQVVLFQPADVGMLCPNPNFGRFESLGDGVMNVGGFLGVSRHIVNHAIADSVVHPRQRAHWQEAASFHEVVTSADTRHAAQAMLKRFRPVDERRNPDWPRVRLLEARYANVRQPALLVWGDQDDVLDVASLDRLAGVLRATRVHHVADAKHSPHQERPLLCAQWIHDFLQHEHLQHERLQHDVPVQGGAGPWVVRPRAVSSR